MPFHSRKIRRIFYLHSRVRPKSGERIQKIHKQAAKLAARVEFEGNTKWLQNAIEKLETKAKSHYNINLKVLGNDKKAAK